VRYCYTAPAYYQSQEYYGEAFRRVPGSRERLFLASKTHERTASGARRLLEESLRRLGTERLDLWQIHDLRTTKDLDAIFARGGALQAVDEARREGKVRFVGLTGHHDPDVLLAAMSRYPFDTVLVPINPADPAHLPFVTTVVPAARAHGMGVIGMKVLAAGALVADGVASALECIRYAMAHSDTSIIGCSSRAEVRENLQVGRTAQAMTPEEQRSFEARIASSWRRYGYFKR
jgi:predicted aldo/keto reductase-like oxidoreductase